MVGRCTSSQLAISGFARSGGKKLELEFDMMMQTYVCPTLFKKKEYPSKKVYRIKDLRAKNAEFFQRDCLRIVRT